MTRGWDYGSRDRGREQDREIMHDHQDTKGKVRREEIVSIFVFEDTKK